MSALSIRSRPVLHSSVLFFFALIAFSITWGVIWGYILFPESAAATFGETSGGHPLYFLATWAPAIAGIALVLAYGGLAGGCVLSSRVSSCGGAMGFGAFCSSGHFAGVRTAPTLDAAVECHNSDKYQAAVGHAKLSSVRDLVVVEEG